MIELSAQPNTTAVKDIGVNPYKLFPNPSAGTFHVCVGGEYTLTVQDVMGRQVLRKEIGGDSSFELPEKGIYVVTLDEGSERKCTKVIVE